MVFNTTPIPDPQVFCPIFNHEIADGLCWDISNIGNDSLMLPPEKNHPVGGMKLIKFAANAPSIKKWGSNNPIQYRQRLCLPGQGCFFHAVFAQWQSAGLQNRMPQLFESSRTKTKTFCKQKTASASLR